MTGSTYDNKAYDGDNPIKVSIICDNTEYEYRI